MSIRSNAITPKEILGNLYRNIYTVESCMKAVMRLGITTNKHLYK